MKYKIFLDKGSASPLQAPWTPYHFFIVSRYSLPHDVDASWDLEKKNSIPHCIYFALFSMF